MNDGDETNFDAAPPEENNNRTFLIAAGILGGVVLLATICLAVYGLFILPGQRAKTLADANAQYTQAAEMSSALTATFQAAVIPTMTLTPLPSPTPVLAPVQATETPIPPTIDPATVTVAAALSALTQVAGTAQSAPPSSPSGMPATGIADEYGIPGLLAATLVLIIVIFVARRMRTSSVRNR
ncbi:MAG: hypothetical protein HY869_20155 [Chloroflexi bacterium]|nr:hypothetical protein [Chloroflexota bacterium]